MTGSIGCPGNRNQSMIVTSSLRSYFAHELYPPSNPLPLSECSKAHQPAIRDNFRPPSPLVLPLAAMAAKRSKKSKIIRFRAESVLMGMKVLKALRDILESEPDQPLNNKKCREYILIS